MTPQNLETFIAQLQETFKKLTVKKMTSAAIIIMLFGITMLLFPFFLPVFVLAAIAGIGLFFAYIASTYFRKK